MRDTFDLGLRVGAVATPLLLCLSGTRSPNMPVTASTRTSHGDCVMRSRRYSGSQKRRTGPGMCHQVDGRWGCVRSNRQAVREALRLSAQMLAGVGSACGSGSVWLSGTSCI